MISTLLRRDPALGILLVIVCAMLRSRIKDACSSLGILLIIVVSSYVEHCLVMFYIVGKYSSRDSSCFLPLGFDRLFFDYNVQEYISQYSFRVVRHNIVLAGMFTFVVCCINAVVSLRGLVPVILMNNLKRSVPF